MLKTIALVVVLLIAGVLIFASIKPDDFRVERVIAIKAQPAKIASHVNDFRQWPAWSPWEKLDPAMKRSFSGAPSGKGAVYVWEGSGKVGAGRMEVLEVAPLKTNIKLDFIKPFEGHNTAEFQYNPQGDSTQVVWSMYGPSPFISKVMGVFFSMDSMIGKDFEAGLANLKAVAEK